MEHDDHEGRVLFDSGAGPSSYHNQGGAMHNQHSCHSYHQHPTAAGAPYAGWNMQQHMPPPAGRLQQYQHVPAAAAVAAAGYGQRMPAAAHGMPAAEQDPLDDSLKAVRDLPALFQPLFNFRYFNPVQSECFDTAYKSDMNMVVSAPTGAGKTGVMELAMLWLLSKHLKPSNSTTLWNNPQQQQQQQQLEPLRGRHKVIYLGPIKALVQERQKDWQARYGSVLGLRCVQLTGDVDDESMEDELEGADIICSTPEKFDQVTRKVKDRGKMGFFAEIALVLIDEVHLLNDSGRGSSLEAGCICRIKAIASIPEMAQAPIASVRMCAVSATIPNMKDIANWLRVPPAGIRQYGDELRPCKLTTHVKGYNPAKNDFLFERRLNDYLYGIVTTYSKGRPALLFCNSRKGTMDSAAVLVKAAEAQARSSTFPAAAPTGSVFVKTAQQLQRLQAAASRVQAKALGAALAAGVGFHNAAMESDDRQVVEELFKANDLAVLCTTSTLAMGVNLPAHLVVIKGTTRYVGDNEAAPGEAAGYKEYTQTEVLQMVGRAGRPQFDNEGVAVIMTNRDSIHRYKQLLAGQPVESCLMTNLAEHLNAEVVLGTIQDVPGAINWIKSSFLYTRVHSNAQHYGIKLRPDMSEAELDGLMKDQLVMQPVSQLMQYNLIATDEDGYSLSSTGAGKLMAQNYLRLRTMASIVQLGERPNMPSLLRVICGAEEFRSTSLRRSEKKVLNDLNHSTDPQQLRFHVMANRDDGTSTSKVKERITTPQEKLFILLNDALADKPADGLDYSLKQEQDRLLVVGQRIAKCMARYYALRNSFSAAGRSLLLARSLWAKLWDDSSIAVRQLPSVGKLLGARLAAAGLGSLKALAACGDAHQVEVAAQKPYPWGSELLDRLRSITPPPVTMRLQVLDVLPNRSLHCQLTLTREEGRNAAQNPASRTPAAHQSTIPAAFGGAWAADADAAGGGNGSGGLQQQDWSHGKASGSNIRLYNTFTPCKLLCGCSSTDQLLLMRNLVLETFESPLELRFKVDPPADHRQPVSISARLMLDKVIGMDDKVSLQVPSATFQQRGGTDSSSNQPAAAAAEDVGDDPFAEGGEDGVGCGNGQQKQLHLTAAAAAAAPATNRQRQRMPQKRALATSSSSSSPGGGIQAGADAAGPSAAAKQPCGPGRQRQAAATQLSHQQRQLLRDWNQPEAQQQRLSSSGVPSNPQRDPHTTNSGLPPVNSLHSSAGRQANHTSSSATAVAAADDNGAADVRFESAAAAPPLLSVPQTSIAAKYNSVYAQSGSNKPAAAGRNHPPANSTAGSGQHPATAAAAAAAPGTVSAVPAASAFALDAAGLQVTPEHARMQQQQQQQSVAPAQQEMRMHTGNNSSQAVEQGGGAKGQEQQRHGGPAQQHETQCHSSHSPEQQQQQQQVADAPSPASQHFAPTGGLSIATMFDMLADEMAWEEEQQQQPLRQQQETGEGSGPAVQRQTGLQQHSGLVATAQQQPAVTAVGHRQQLNLLGAPNLSCPEIPSSPAATVSAAAAPAVLSNSAVLHRPPVPRSSSSAAAAGASAQSLSSVFGAAVLQQHRTYTSCPPQAGQSSRPAAAKSTTSASNSIPQQLHAGLRSQRLGLSGGSSWCTGAANSNSSAAEALLPVSIQQQQQHGAFRSSSSSRAPERNSSIHTQQVESDVPAGAAATAATEAEGPAAAAAGYHASAADADFVTPPRQIRRASSSYGTNAPDLTAAAASEDMPPPTPPNFQRFAFGAGTAKAAGTGPEVYRPSQNSLMFQRTSLAANSRALAQAKLARNGSNTSCSTGYLKGGAAGSHACQDQQQYAQLIPPAAPKAAAQPRQWGSFVNDQQHGAAAVAIGGYQGGSSSTSISSQLGGVWQATGLATGIMSAGGPQQKMQQQQAARRAARAAWQPPANGPAARHLLLGGHAAGTAFGSTGVNVSSSSSSWGTGVGSVDGPPGGAAGLRSVSTPAAGHQHTAGLALGSYGAAAAQVDAAAGGAHESEGGDGVPSGMHQQLGARGQVRAPAAVGGSLLGGSLGGHGMHQPRAVRGMLTAVDTNNGGFGLPTSSHGQQPAANDTGDAVQGAQRAPAAAAAAPQVQQRMSPAPQVAADSAAADAAEDELDFGAIFDFMK